MGVGPIPVSEVLAYAGPLGFADTPDEFETLLMRVQAADNAFLEWQRRNPNRASERGTAHDKTDEDAARFGLYIER